MNEIKPFKVKLGEAWVLPYTVLRFSGGEIQVKIQMKPANVGTAYAPITIHAHLTSSDRVMELVMLVDAICRWCPDKTVQIHLVCPYLPYARQDRVCDPGEALALKNMCSIINALRFATVQVWDVHSDVSLALLDRVQNIPQENFVSKIPSTSEALGPVLVAPDAGAMKKIGAVAKELNLNMVRADKIRSTVDGSITGTKVYSGPIGDRDFLIVDDICDGGRTFIELAKELRPLTDGKVLLYVTHGIFSRGVDALEGIDHIYCAKVFPDVDINNPKLTVLA